MTTKPRRPSPPRPRPAPPPAPPVTDRDELPTPCGQCGGETFWHRDPGDKAPTLICLDCTRFAPDGWAGN